MGPIRGGASQAPQSFFWRVPFGPLDIDPGMGLWHLHWISRVDWVSDPFLTHPLGGRRPWREVQGPCGTEGSATDARRPQPNPPPLPCAWVPLRGYHRVTECAGYL